ncbi:MAG: succinyl-diaminopimelate desuccinylase [Alphaproteobacteria bacterium]|nr:succinyl-diaminopimelate desuccinylase [Alphaproteobacteria bacterium]
MLDPVTLAQELIRRPSVTPADAGALDVLQAALSKLGFVCQRLPFGDVDNLYARLGESGPNFCFAGHTDVVPPGEGWRHAPFEGVVENGTLFGRGAADMKSAIAAFVAAVARHGKPNGSISLLITGDEEGIGINGTQKVLGWLKERGETLNHCLVGEPTATARAGDTIKIGRRGSLNVELAAMGVQGHVGYPAKAKNPIPPLALLVTRLSARKLDDGSAHFDPSNLCFTTMDVGNPATNVIPGEARARLNIRFNDLHTAESLIAWIEDEVAKVVTETGAEISVTPQISGVSFLTPPGAFTALVAQAVESVTGKAPEFSTSGGTSDARFIRQACPVLELGLAGTTMHKVNECVPVAEIAALADIYAAILKTYFENPPK